MLQKMPKKAFFLAVLVLCLAISCQSVGDDPGIPFDENVKSGVLANGLSYYIVENDKPENRAELQLIVDAGSILEDEDQQGLAHFLEHMAFNGTELYPKNDLISFLQDIGMGFGPDINAYTSFDETVYMLSVPTDLEGHLEKSIEVLEQWAFHITLNEQDVIDERGVVLEEWRLGQGSRQRILNQILPVLFEDSLYAERLPIGKDEIIRSADSQTLRRFYKDWYRPELMALVAVGDFDAAEVEAIIQRRFSGYENPEPSRSRAAVEVPNLQKERYILASDPEETIASIDILNRYETAEFLMPDDYRSPLIEGLFYSMINQRFFELVQEPDPPFIGAESRHISYTRWTQHNNTSLVSTVDGVEGALNSISREYERLRRYGFLQSELDRAKKQELLVYENAWKNRNSREHQEYIAPIQSHYLTGQPLASIDWEWRTVQRLMPDIVLEDFLQLIDERLNDKNSSIIITGPQELENDPITQDGAFAALRVAKQEKILPWLDSPSLEQLVQSPPSPGSIVSEAYDEASGIYTWELSNNARVFAKPTDFKDNEILFAADSPGGLSIVEDNEWVSGSLASNAVSISGLGDMSAVDVQKFLADKQVGISFRIFEYEEGHSANASPEDLETLLQLNYLYFTSIGRDEDAWKSYSTRLAAYLENQEREPRVQYLERLNSILYNDHVRSQSFFTLNVEDADYSQALDIFRGRFSNAGDFTFFFVGSFDPEELKASVERWIASIPGTTEKETPVDRGLDYFTGEIRDEIYAGIEPLSLVSMNWNAPTAWNYDTLYDISALSALLDILLIEKIREEEGGTYSINSGFALDNVPDEDYQLIIQFSTAPDQVDRLIGIVQEEIERIINDGVDESYAQKVSENQRVNYLENLERNGWWLNQIRFLVKNELDWYYALEKTRWYNALTAEQLQNSARRFFTDANYAEVILFPEEQ